MTRFQVTRTSLYDPEFPPCTGAVKDAGGWYVEIDNLDDLLAFRAQHGKLIVSASDGDLETPTIEIYDGMRE